MRRVAPLLAVLALTAFPVAAQESDAPEGAETGQGLDLIEEGTRLLLRGLADQMRPMLDDLETQIEPELRDLTTRLMPLMQQFSDLVGDLDQYEAPERLPNGDIILRRKTPLDAPEPPAGLPPTDEGEIDL